MNIHESAEDYLEKILMLQEQKGSVRSIDIAVAMGFSKPSVSVAMKNLREKGVNILVDEGVLYKKRGIGMFVATGAKEGILNRRRNEFYDNYVKKLLEEAASIGLDKEEVIRLIQTGNR